MSEMYKAVPPLQEMVNMAGMQLPNYLKGETMNTKDETSEDSSNTTSEA